jgi:hypothetical protein
VKRVKSCATDGRTTDKDSAHYDHLVGFLSISIIFSTPSKGRIGINAL